MAKWRVPVEWTMCAVAEIEAHTEESFFKFKRGDHVLYKGESQTVVGLCVREDNPAYELRPVDVGGQTYWWPIAEDKLRRTDNISGAGIQELFD